MTQLPILIIKFGTASITQTNGEPDETIIADIARQVSELHARYHIVIVSSGAVGAGKHYIKQYSGQIAERKAAAAIGNPLLLSIYSRYFSAYNIQIAQSLCERQHFGNREQFLQLKETYQELWANGIIPIANENDVVSNRELKFSDNDELATLIATGFGAETLMICTSVGGLLDKEKNIIRKIETIDNQILGLVDNSKSALGSGGMASKLTFTKLATRMGIKVIIFGMKTPDGILNALQGQAGSEFLPQEVNLSSRNKWLASGSLTVGTLQIDAGAVKALQKRSSLLAVGIKKVKGDFEAGEVVEITDGHGVMVGVARIRVTSAELKANLSTQNFEVANANDIVLI
ncbi:glutamate 5-kinase [Emticicia sp. 21SJ11W-3]|uniref:glutamate 5-kinase n=1 Tax=Emticicia sp. 21SJ11W-3 TaxID=2916755 RepID=UPI00209F03BA|nr:glutamate 5-kinase [Emticicia sp. 21SJ11W-3]UTA68267.1 glutamate 5-kinase [Emticicia sp. 21SJ11W-3]